MLIVTTAISGSGRKEYLKKFEEYAESQKKKVKVYHVGNMLFEQAKKIGVPLTTKNVLNTNPFVLNSLKSAVFESILTTLPKDLKKYDAVVLSIHSFFYWKKIFTRAYDRFYLGNFKADIFCSLIDDARNIKKRLDGKEQWKDENLSVQEILLWQNIEVEVTSSWADMYQKPFYAVPVNQPIETFYDTIFYPERDLVYVSMPITHLKGKKDQAKVDRFIEKLKKYFTVFDPRVVEQSAGFGVVNLKGTKDKTFFNQIVNRDFYWFVKQCNRIIVFFPKIVSSPGVINELREAHETNKTVWVVHPGKAGSPFLTYFSDRVFSDEKELFKFLEKEYKKKPPKNR